MCFIFNMIVKITATLFSVSSFVVKHLAFSDKCIGDKNGICMVRMFSCESPLDYIQAYLRYFGRTDPRVSQS